jgi:hypothetical protein
VFTHNNWTKDDEDAYGKLHRKGWARFLVYGKEVAPTTETMHLQGFLWTDKPYSLQQVQRKLKGAWVAVPGKDKGVAYHVEDDGKTGFGYCFKEHQPGWVLTGIPPTDEEFEAQCPKGQGARSDLLAVKKAIDEGATCADLVEDDAHFGTFAAHSKFFAQYQSAKRRRRRYEAPYVEVIHGDSGTNKSRRVHEKFDYDMSKLWKLPPALCTGQTVWYDGYAGHEAVLIEEFRPGTMKFDQLLDILDGYPTMVQVKGGSVHWSPKEIYITSPVPPEEWYPNLAANDKIAQLMRRITKVTHSSPHESPPDPPQFDAQP